MNVYRTDLAMAALNGLGSSVAALELTVNMWELADDMLRTGGE